MKVMFEVDSEDLKKFAKFFSGSIDSLLSSKKGLELANEFLTNLADGVKDLKPYAEDAEEDAEKDIDLAIAKAREKKNEDADLERVKEIVKGIPFKKNYQTLDAVSKLNANIRKYGSADVFDLLTACYRAVGTLDKRSQHLVFEYGWKKPIIMRSDITSIIDPDTIVKLEDDESL